MPQLQVLRDYDKLGQGCQRYSLQARSGQWSRMIWSLGLRQCQPWPCALHMACRVGLVYAACGVGLDLVPWVLLAAQGTGLEHLLHVAPALDQPHVIALGLV